MLPVQEGEGFGIKAENNTPFMAAFPARLSNAKGDHLNVFAECEVTNPADMPSTGGMLEATPGNGAPFDGLLLPGNQKAPFVANAGTAARHGGKIYDRIEVFYRFPADPGAIHGMPSGATSRGGLAIDTGPVVGDKRTITNLDYENEAHPFGVIHLVDREAVAAMLAKGGLEGIDLQNDEHWSSSYFLRRGFRPTDLSVGRVS